MIVEDVLVRNRPRILSPPFGDPVTARSYAAAYPRVNRLAKAKRSKLAASGQPIARPITLLYGTNANKSNAFGKCVSKLATQNSNNQSNAAASCRSERTADPAAFAIKYGTGKKHANAFGNCVSQTAKAAAKAQQEATTNAAKACWTERKPDPAAFKAKYGTNANKSNAFGKCVSGKVKHTP
jgi:hypothetical protein